MPFNINKYHILHVGTRNQIFDYEMNGFNLDSVQCVKELGVSIASSLKFSQQCKDAAGKGNRMLGFINRNFSIKYRNIILPLYISLVRPHLEHAVCCVILVSPSNTEYSKIRNCSERLRR